jgi:hypothetical protein
MLIQYLLDSTYIVLEYTNTMIHTKGKKQCTCFELDSPPLENVINLSNHQIDRSFYIIFQVRFFLEIIVAFHEFVQTIPLTPKDPCVFLAKTTSNQPLLRTR